MYPDPSVAPESCRVVAAERACSADIQPNRPGPAKETVGIVLVVVPNNTGDVGDLETLGGQGLEGACSHRDQRKERCWLSSKAKRGGSDPPSPRGPWTEADHFLFDIRSISLHLIRILYPLG